VSFGAARALYVESMAKSGDTHKVAKVKKELRNAVGYFLRHNTICTIEEIFSAVYIVCFLIKRNIIHHSQRGFWFFFFKA